MNANYGLIHKDVVPLQAYALVKEFWGHRDIEYQKSAFFLIWGTSAVESNCGSFKDPTPKKAGEGHSQWDEKPFYDYVKRCPGKLREQIKEKFDMDIRDHKWSELYHSAGVSSLHTAMAYKMIPETFPIPYTPEVLGAYWKKWYNSSLGDGTVEKFVEKFNLYVREKVWDALERNNGLIC